MRVSLILLTILLLIITSSYVYSQTSRVTDKYGNELVIKSNSITNSVKRVYRVNAPTTRHDVSIDQINPSNIEQLGKSIIKDYEDILDISSGDLKVYKAKRGRKSSWHLGFRQLHQNVPVWNSYVRFTIRGQGIVKTISAKIYPDIKLSTSPSISADYALSAALSAFKEDDTDTVIVKEMPSLCIYPKIVENAVSYYLTYKVDLVSKGLLYFVDAYTGKVVKIINNWRDYNNNGTVSIKYFPEHYYDTPVVYDGRSGIYVKISNYLGQKMGDDYTDSNGDYSINWYGAYSTYYLKGTGNLHLYNSYAEILNYDPIDHNYSFLPGSNHRHNWTYATDETNVFYHMNVIHDYITASPFYFDDMDYQMDGSVDQGVNVNGGSSGINIRFGSQGGYQWARSSDVVYHEYTHCIVYHLYDGWIEPDDDEYNTEGYAMDEGFADYFACTLNDDSRMGESVGLASYRNMDNDDTMDDWESENEPETPYINGMIVAGAVWDMRETASIGNDLADELLFFALASNPDEFDGLLDEILNEDDTDADLSNGTPHIDAILYAFENHKIYSSDPDVPPAAPKNLEVSESGWHPRLDWDENTEPDLQDYDVWRYCAYFDPTWRKVATTTNNYWIDPEVDSTVPAEPIYYKVKAVDDDDNESSYSNQDYIMGYRFKPIATNTIAEIPTSFFLNQNYPNPFNPETQIRFGLPEDSKVTIEVFNLQGQKVATIANGYYEAGYHSITFRGANHPSGVYFYRTVAGDFQDIKRMLLIK